MSRTRFEMRLDFIRACTSPVKLTESFKRANLRGSVGLRLAGELVDHGFLKKQKPGGDLRFDGRTKYMLVTTDKGREVLRVMDSRVVRELMEI